MPPLALCLVRSFDKFSELLLLTLFIGGNTVVPARDIDPANILSDDVVRPRIPVAASSSGTSTPLPRSGSGSLTQTLLQSPGQEPIEPRYTLKGPIGEIRRTSGNNSPGSPSHSRHSSGGSGGYPDSWHGFSDSGSRQGSRQGSPMNTSLPGSPAGSRSGSRAGSPMDEDAPLNIPPTRPRRDSRLRESFTASQIPGPSSSSGSTRRRPVVLEDDEEEEDI